MALHKSSNRYLFLFLPVCFILSSCNLFSTMHSDGHDSDAHVLVADGQAAYKRGEYAKAKEYFRLAKEHNPRDSEAIMGYAQAFMKVQGFSLGQFAKSFLDTMNKNSGSIDQYYNLVVPEQWGVASKTEVGSICTLLLSDLEKICAGETVGPYKSVDVDINLTVAIFYALRAAIQAEILPTLYQLRTLQKSSPLVQAAFSPDILMFLPNEFLWFADVSGNPLTPSSFDSLRSDIHQAAIRMQVAVDHAASKDALKDIMEKIRDWDQIANP
jgi:hypothetical protein